jgi:hypothetical protein
MAAVGDILKGVSSLLPWVVIFAIFWRYRNDLAGILALLRQQIASGAAIKFKNFELKGVDIASFDARDGSAYRLEVADEGLFQRRHESYQENKNLFLVHRVRPTGENHEINRQPTYDISVYLISHKNFGHINDVFKVEYYFGDYFGREKGKFGTKYVVENGSDGFAVRTNAYGPMLCEARVIFHDGSETTVSRYLDFEGTNYRFSPEVNLSDVAKAGIPRIAA